ncbi:MAG: hypothetical protein ABW001_00470 [Mycobacterium sp.]
MIRPKVLSRGNFDPIPSGPGRHSGGRAENEAEWSELFADDVCEADGVEVERRRTPLAGAFGAGAIVIAVAAVAASVLLGRFAEEATAASSTSTTAPGVAAPKPLAQALLLRSLPGGFDADGCTATAVPPDALASIQCSAGVDAGGPTAATLVAYRDEVDLATRFVESMRRLRIIDCPGGFQSPGPWHRGRTPQQGQGIVVCGYRNGVATVDWTNIADLTMSSVAADAPEVSAGEALDRIFRWWSTQ